MHGFDQPPHGTASHEFSISFSFEKLLCGNARFWLHHWPRVSLSLHRYRTLIVLVRRLFCRIGNTRHRGISLFARTHCLSSCPMFRIPFLNLAPLTFPSRSRLPDKRIHLLSSSLTLQDRAHDGGLRRPFKSI